MYVIGSQPMGAALLPDTPTKATCNAKGVCVPTNQDTKNKFLRFQQELKRVRQLHGLSGDVTVDGVLGPQSVVRLIQLAPHLKDAPAIFDKYAIEVDGYMPTPQELMVDVYPLTVALGLYKSPTAAVVVPPTPPTPPTTTPSQPTKAGEPQVTYQTAPPPSSYAPPQVQVVTVPAATAAIVPISKGPLVIGAVVGFLGLVGLLTWALKKK